MSSLSATARCVTRCSAASFGGRRRGGVPRRGDERVDRLAEREMLARSARGELDQARGAIALQEHVDDHLRQRLRGAELVERRPRLAPNSSTAA